MTPLIYLFGATSILGFNIARLFPRSVLPFVPPGNRSRSVRHWPALNLDGAEWAPALFAARQPEILIYCHAVCDVPKCEAAPAWAGEINVDYIRRLIEALSDRTRLVYVSSDHVFGGDGVYDERSPPCPISVYGKTRVEAEDVVLNRPNSLVIRTGLAIGPSPNGRTGHWDWLRYRTRRNLPVTIVYNEYRSVVWASDLAKRVLQLADSSETGIRHVPATRVLSRVELADHLLDISGITADYRRESRHQRGAPHLGRVELASLYRGVLFDALPSVTEDPAINLAESQSSNL